MIRGPKKSESHLAAEISYPELVEEKSHLVAAYGGLLGGITESAARSVKSRAELEAIRDEIEAFNARWVAAGFDAGRGLAAPTDEEIDRLFPRTDEVQSENFGELSSSQQSWVKANAKRWTAGERVRYYVQLHAALALAGCVDEEKKGSPVAILGLSKTKSSAQMVSWAVYFDAVEGVMRQNGTKNELYDAFMSAFGGLS